MALEKLKTSVTFRLFMIGGLTLILLIPAQLIQSLISERQSRRDSAIQEVSEKWGKSQTISGPVVTIPFLKPFKGEKGEITYSTEYAHFLPENLTIRASLIPEIRYRGIFQVILYNAKIQLVGNFPPFNFDQWSVAPENVLWKDATVTIGISDLKGIKDAVTLNWNNASLTANPGTESSKIMNVGINVKPDIKAGNQTYTFGCNLNLNGSEDLKFLPVGKETKATVTAVWGNPSFLGAFLPATRTIQKDSSGAEWKVLHLNRNYPQQWLDHEYFIGEASIRHSGRFSSTDEIDEPFNEKNYKAQDMMQSAFGVKLLMPIDEYQKTMRTAKYAIMFITLTFLSFFITEILNRKQIHPIQYLLIGLALIIFYTLLLSLSEHITFNLTYWIASLSILALITAYTKSVLSNNTATLIIAGILLTLYLFLFVVLQLQDYALLLGSIGLFVILAAIMYITRKIDWYNIGKAETASTPPPQQQQ